MSGITDPGEEYFKNGLWAWVTDQWKKLIGDDAGHLQVDVVESGLPSGAATSANQATMITALQLIDDLRAALNSVATDELDVVIDGQTTDVEVTQTTAADLTPGIMGWDGSAWRKLPLVWGYSDRIVENLVHTMTADGNYTMAFTAVPAGETLVLQSVAWTNRHQAVRGIVSVETDGTPVTYLQDVGSPGTWQYSVWRGEIVLKAGDFVQILFVSNLDTQIVDGFIWGYKMKVAE